jgi:hypothetical protein
MCNQQTTSIRNESTTGTNVAATGSWYQTAPTCAFFYQGGDAFVFRSGSCSGSLTSEVNPTTGGFQIQELL